MLITSLVVRYLAATHLVVRRCRSVSSVVPPALQPIVQCNIYAGMVAEVLAVFEGTSCPRHFDRDRPAIRARPWPGGAVAAALSSRLVGRQRRSLLARSRLLRRLLVSLARRPGPGAIVRGHRAGSLHRSDGEIPARQGLGLIPALEPHPQPNHPCRRGGPHLLLRGVYHHV